MLYIAIDSPTTRDVDDAIALAKREEGGWRASILIANPSQFVAPGSVEDDFARQQGATVYQGHRVAQSMLPRSIGEQRAALSDRERRPSLQLDLDISPELDVSVADLGFHMHRLAAHVPYSDVAALARAGGSPIEQSLREMITVSQSLLGARRSRGALAFYDLTKLLFLDEEGRVQRAKNADDAIGQILVQEFMVLANSAIATWAVEHDVPILFRNHQARSASPPPATVARNVEAWLQGSALNETAIRDQLNLLLGAASYSASVEGHYALNLPAYTHATSPIRRYPDLVTERQVVAAVRGKSLPYAKSDLDEIAAELNETLAKRKAERSEGFKQTVVRRASTAMEREHFSRLADHELGQVIKLALEAGQFAEPLCEELVARINGGTLSEKNLDRLLVTPAVVPLPVRETWAAALTQAPHRAKHHLMHALQTGLFREQQARDEPVGAQFRVTLEVMRASDGARLAVDATSGRKQDASNRATANLIRQHLDVPAPSAASIAGDAQAADVEKSSTNWKGRVLERCQKERWPMPAFKATPMGPVHAPDFTCVARLELPDGPIETTFTGGRTRMEAEQGAARGLWEKLPKATAKPAAAGKGTNPGVNPISALQERCQKAGLAIPEYQLDGPPLGPFNCVLTVALLPGVLVRADGPNKAEARRNAAARALKQLQG